jgi:hypothetical protein
MGDQVLPELAKVLTADEPPATDGTGMSKGDDPLEPPRRAENTRARADQPAEERR